LCERQRQRTVEMELAIWAQMPLAAFLVFALLALRPKESAGMSRPRSTSLAQMETPCRTPKRHAHANVSESTHSA
jgi:hypothetical protein